VLFSLLLPVVVLVARRVVLPLWLSLPAVLAGIGLVTAVGWGTASYLGVFVVGVLLAQHRQTLTGWAGRVQELRAGGVVEAAVLLLAGGLLLSEIWLGLAVVDPWLCGMLGRPGAVLGAALLVVCCLHAPGMRRLMSTRPLHWLGTVSFALYLVHEPIVVSIAAVVGPTAVGVTLTLVGGTLGSLGAAVLFHHVVEKPSMRLADRLGRRGLRPASPVLTFDHVAATDRVLLGRGRSCSSATTARVPARAR
jgi:peptidoglycan/LPS O-acetylase OafA/YrhL